MTDPSGAPIPAVQVVALNMETGVTRTVSTNQDGFYAVPKLAPGTYRISATATGFSKKIATDVVLAVGAEASPHVGCSCLKIACNCA